MMREKSHMDIVFLLQCLFSKNKNRFCLRRFYGLIEFLQVNTRFLDSC